MLPKIATPKYDMIVPSTGESITYRPYLVKEEKILLIAMESQSDEAMETAVIDIIELCVETPINVKTLTTFDIEYIFVSLRAKSVGEGIKLNPTCEHCEEVNEDIKIDLDKVIVSGLEEEINMNVKLTDDISVDVTWPTMKNKLTEDDMKTGTDTLINMVARGIGTIYSGEEIFAAADSTKKELVEFVESLGSDNFNALLTKVSEAPQLTYDLEFKCKACGKDNKLELKGLTDFFQ
jgi:hypothetical protein|tara:strand:- start:544 stop:1251 length:708 start_codon:yes stop_codon:yes gene_type:complete